MRSRAVVHIISFIICWCSALTVFLHPISAFANPEGGVVAAGQATIITAATSVDIHQQTDRAVIDWRGFDIAPNERTEFHQPSADAITLNRVHSANASVIEGSLKANGNVLVVNQNGVLFSRNAVVDVNGLVATSADVSNDKFMNDRAPKFDQPGNPNAAVVNDGNITAKQGGLVGFVAPRVENNGVITARLGRVHLAAGDKATVDFYGDGLMEVAVSDDVHQQLVRNRGAISADGGTIALTAAAGSKLLSSAIQVSGVLQAQAVSQRDGKIVISSLGSNAVAGNVSGNKHKVPYTSTVDVAARIDASGRNTGERGGNISITGDAVHVASSSIVDARGANGGGVIHVGGEYLGGGVTPVAQTLTVDHGALLDASATVQGHGGEVIAFADGTTWFNGSIRANGAGLRGNGGFVETSGKGILHFAGDVQAIASQGGKAGTWLLDPADITISNINPTIFVSASPNFQPNSAGGSFVHVNDITTALNLGTNVTVQTNNDAFAGNGDIFVNSAITATGSGALTLNAYRNLNVNSNITMAGGALNLIATTGNIAGSGNIVNGGGLVTATQATAGTLSGIISGTGGLTKLGAGALTLSGANTYTGATTVNAGSLVVSGQPYFNVGRTTSIASGATLQLLNSNNTFGANIPISTVNGSGTLQFAGTSTYSLSAGGSANRLNIAMGAGGLLDLQGTSYFLNGGFQSVGWTGNLGSLNVASGASFDIWDGNTVIVDALNGAGSIVKGFAGTQTLQLGVNGGSGTFSGSISNASGTLNITKTGAGTQTLSGANTYTGTTTVSAGTLSLTGSLNRGAATATTAVASGATLSGAGVITAATLSHSGLGTVNLTGNNLIGAVATGGSIGALTLNNAQSISLGATTATSIAVTTNAANADITVGGALTTGAGAISLSSFRNIDVNAAITLANGALTLRSNNAANAAGGAVYTSAAINSGGGNITIGGGSAAITAATLAANGSITTAATGYAQGNASRPTGVQIGGAISAAGGTILINGQGENGTNTNRGVEQLVGNAISTTGAGAIRINGIAQGTAGNSNQLNGVALRNLVTTVTGNIEITGTGGGGTGSNSSGVFVSAAGGILRSTGTGNIVLSGTAGTTTGIAQGVLVNNLLGINPTSTGTITIYGTGGAGTGGSKQGVLLGSPGPASIVGNGGAITITGLGGTSSTSNGNYGISLNGNGTAGSAIITNTGTGTITLTGTGGGSGASTSNHGVYINGVGASIGTTGSGAIAVTGTGGTGTGGSNHGVYSSVANGITTSGTSNITINGTRGSTSGFGFITDVANGVSKTGGGVNTITLLSDTFSLNAASNIITPGTIVVAPRTAITFGLGTGAGTLQFTDTMLGYLNATIGYTFGSTTASDVTVNTALPFTARNLTFISNGNLVITNVFDGTGTFTTQTTNGSTTLNGIIGGTTAVGNVTMTGRDLFLNQNLRSSGNISGVFSRDITLAATRTVTTGAAGALTLTAAGNNVNGSGDFNLNGNLSVGTGALTLLSGARVARPSYTITTTNLIPQTGTFGAVSIQGFLDTFINRDITSNNNITILGFRDVTLNALNTLRTAAASSLSVRAANANTANTGSLYLNGILRPGTGALTLLSGQTGGVRPSWTATTTSLNPVGATFGAIDVQGFNDFAIARTLNSTAAVTFSNNTRTVLLGTVSSSGGAITFNNPLAVGANSTISTTNQAINFNSTVTGISPVVSAVQALVVAGGGGGGGGTGGGGGAGGLLYNAAIATTSGTINAVTVGAGGTGGGIFNNTLTPPGTNGGNSVFSTLTSIGGGGGGANNNVNALTGGSGGGGAWNSSGAVGTGGQGNAGANGSGGGGAPNFGSGGGGGAGAAGAAGTTTTGGNGGAGLSNSITGAAVTYAGGGGGGIFATTTSFGTGGSGGGGAGGRTGTAGTNGTNGLGGGGGGAGDNNTNGGNGGSGVVILRYTGAATDVTTTGGVATTVGGDTVWTFNQSGNFTALGCAGGCGLTVNSGTAATTFTSAVNGVALNVTAGTATFLAPLGATTALGASTITTTSTLFLPAITAASLNVNASGASSTLYVTGNLATTQSGGALSLTSGSNLLTNGATSITSTNGAISFNAANTLFLAAPLTTINSSGGNVALTGTTGGIVNGNALTLSTSGGNATFNQALTLAAPLTLSLGAGTANFASTINGSSVLANFSTLAVGAGGGGGGTDGIRGGGGGGGGAVDAVVTVIPGSVYTVGVGGGGGGGVNSLASAAGGAGGVNGGAAGGAAGSGGASGGGGGGGGFSGIYIGGTYYVVAGGGAGGGGANEGFANDVAAQGGGSQTSNTGVTSGSVGQTFVGDGGGGGGGGGGFFGGAGQTNVAVSTAAAFTNGGANYSNPGNSSTILTTGNAGFIQAAGSAGAATTSIAAGRATFYGYGNNAGAGGNAAAGGTAGGDGTVIIRYTGTTAQALAIGGVVTTSGGDVIVTYTTPGTTSSFTPIAGCSGSCTLTVNAGNVTFGGAVGSIAALDGLTVTGTAITVPGNVTVTNGPIAFNGPLTLTGNSVMSAGTGTNSFGGTVNGAFNLTSTAATITFAGAVGGVTPLNNVSLTATNAVTLPAITATTVLARTTGAAANITLGGNITASATSGTSITLAAGRDLDNSGNNLLNLAGTARWLVYSADPADAIVAKGGLTETFNRYNCTYAGGCTAPVTIPTTGNGYVYVFQPSSVINGVVANNKVYDGLTAATLNTSGASITGLLSGDLPNILYGGATVLFSDKNAATGKTVTVTNLFDDFGYAYTISGLTADITPRTLNVTYTGVNRVYDGGVVATVTTSDDRVGGDVLTINRSAAFADKNVANGKTVSVTGVNLTNTDAGNYTVSATGSTTANITPRTLNVTYTGVNRVYDGGVVATVTTSDDRVGGDVLTINRSASFADKNVANGKTVSVSGVNLTNTDAGNYMVSATGSTTANITQRTLNVTYSGVNRVYDGSTVATVTTSDDRVGGDVLTINRSASFADKNVANGKTVSVTGVNLTNTDAGNYTVSATGSTTANITPRTLNVTYSGVNRVYDGTPTATVTTSDDRVGGDVLTINRSASFADKNVANGKTVSVSGVNLTNTDAGNYTVSATGSTTANITPRTLNVTYTGVNKVYDGGVVATVTTSDDRVGGDVLTINRSASFADKNMANGKTVSVTGVSLTNTDAGNYTVSATGSTTANITPRTLTISATGIDKVYDGNATAAVNFTDNRVGGDALTIGYSTALFPDKNVGVGRTVSVSGLSLSNTDAGNYTFNTTATTTATISQRTLNVTYSGVNRVYDGTSTAAVTTTDDRVAGDALTINRSASFADKNVANGKTVSVTGVNLTNTDAGNYTVSATGSTTADITQRAITITAAGINKVYDGNNIAGITLGDNRVLGDVLTTGFGSALFPDKNVGNGRTITTTGITLTGTDAGNYTFNTTATSTANITPRALTVSASATSRPYDGTDIASVTLSDDRVVGDTLSTSYFTALFPDKNVGVNRTVTISGIAISGTDSGNYSFNTTATALANIIKATLIVTADDKSVTYGTTPPAGTVSYSGFVSGEDATFLTTAPTASSTLSGLQNVGTYNGNYIASGGVDANYGFSYVAGKLSVIRKDLNITADNQTVTYGVATPGGSISYSGFIAGEDASFLTTAPTISSGLSGLQNVGTYAGNYTVSGGSSSNYLFHYFTGNLVVTQRNLNVSADNKTINYGVVVPAGSISYSGFIAGDNVGVLNVLPTVSSGLSGIQNAGTYLGNYTVGGGSDNNYNFIYTPGTLTITPTGLNVTVANQAVTYGTAVPTSTITYTGFVAGEDASFLTTAPTVSSGLSGIQNVATYAGNYTASGGVSSNYSFNYIAGNLTVTPKALNVTAGNQTVTYGTPVPSSTITYTGFIAGEDASFLSTAPTVSSTQSGIVAAGTYAANYSAAGGVATNYSFNYISGDLVVAKKTLTVAANPQTIVYGTAVPSTTINYTGFIAGENASYLTTAPTLSSAQSGILPVGLYSGNYTASGGVSNNYTFSYSAGDLTILRKILTVTAQSQTISYGTVVPGTTLAYSGFISGENASFLTTAPSITSTLSGIVNAANYGGNYVLAGGVADNYSFTYNHGNLSVNPANVSVTANNVILTYGAPNLLNGYTITGLQLGQTIGSVTLTPSASTSGSLNWNVGSWNITPSAASGGTFNPANYNITYTNGALNVTQRALVLNATSPGKIYDGLATAPVTLSDNRVGGDAFTVGFGSALFPDKNAGLARTINVTGITLVGADAANYSFATTISTTGDINRRTLNITATGINKIYDGSATAGVSFSDNRLAGDSLTTNYTNASFADKNAGNGRLITVSGIALSGGDSANYNTANFVTTTANITPRALTVTAIGSDKTFDGNANATVTLSDNRLAGDQLTRAFTSALFPDAAVGNNRAITVSGITLSGVDAGNYQANALAFATASILPGTTVPPITPVMETLPNTVVYVSQAANDVVSPSLDDGIYATPTGAYMLVYLPSNAPLANQLGNVPLPAPITAPSLGEPDEEKRLRLQREQVI